MVVNRHEVQTLPRVWYFDPTQSIIDIIVHEFCSFRSCVNVQIMDIRKLIKSCIQNLSSKYRNNSQSNIQRNDNISSR